MTKTKKQVKMVTSKKSKQAANFEGLCDSENNNQMTNDQLLMTNEGNSLTLDIRISSFGFY
ncbi:MAG: hypothetical protein ABH861_04015 [Patescibacteria group bacterium]|nr:hypothetical protein [Patescibacteria group bacterium]